MHRMSLFSALSLALVPVSGLAQSAELSVTTAHQSAKEVQTKAQLERRIAANDVRR